MAQLRDAKRDASSGTAEALEKITRAIRKRFGRRVRIIVRADSGFAREEIMAWCEDHAVYYCLGLARNKRLSARLGKGLGELYRAIESAEIQVPCRRFEDFAYRTRKSWSRARRVVGKAEILDKGQNPRFVVTNLPAEGLPGEPQERFGARRLYEKLYCARGEMENRIKEAQQDLFADRTSTSWMAPTNSGSGSRLSLISWSRCCALRCWLAPIWPAPPWARSGSSFSRSLPASRSVAGASIWS